MKTLQLLLLLTTGILYPSFAQKQGYQFIYYVEQNQNQFTYYFSDMFTVDDWYKNKTEIIRKFTKLLNEEGIEQRAYTIKEGITGMPISDFYQAIAHIGIIIKRDKNNFEQKQHKLPFSKRPVFKSYTKTLFLQRITTNSG